MSYAVTSYPGGAETYAVPFPYITEDHVRVYLATTAASPQVFTLYTGVVTWLSPTVIQLAPDATGSQTVRIQRVTPVTNGLAAYGSPISNHDILIGDIQNRYAIQELYDGGGGASIGTGGSSGPTLWSEILGIPSEWPGTLPYARLTGITAAIAAIIAAGAPSAGKVFEWTSPTAGHYITTPVSGGGGGGGNMQPRLLSDFGAVDALGANPTTNDATVAIAEAAADSAVYLPDGIFALTATVPQFQGLTKSYTGRGLWHQGTSYVPADFSYMAVKPTTAPTQGLTGWFTGDQRFTDGGEYKIIGPGVRQYDLTIRYFESNVIPHHMWMDINSGNGGTQGYLTSGANIGDTTVTIHAAPDASWVGKTVGFAAGPDGTVLDSGVVSAVNIGAKTVTFGTPLTHNYVWNPGAASYPVILFGHRTWAGPHYMKLTHAGGGDSYGIIIRNNANYVPLASEDHPFIAATTSQIGGDVYANADGNFLQCWESQLQGQTYDVTGIGFVQSYVRNKDESFFRKNWGHIFTQSTGTRPLDWAYSVAGNWRNVLDSVFAALYETTTLTAIANAGSSGLVVLASNGAHIGDTVQIGAETFTIGSIPAASAAGTIGFSTGTLAGTYAAGTLVTFPKGGAVINSALGQRWVMNSALSATQRGSDPRGVFPVSYGNKQGDMIMESGNNGSSDYIAWRCMRGGSAAAPDTARLRMLATGVQMFGSGHTVNGAIGLTAGLNMLTNQLLTLGSGAWIVFDGSVIKATANGGGSFFTLAS